MVDIDPRPRGPGRPPKQHPQQGETAAHEEAEEEEQHKQYLGEQAEKEGRVDPSMPGFTTTFWRRLMATPIATMNLSEWGVLAELALVMVPGSVEAERMFSIMTFIKDNLRNRLTTHLSPCARIYSQHTSTLSNFPYAEAIMAWRAAAPTRGRYGSKN